jgi:aminocarboxymuconate-semialdehyde decarboxylase
MQGQILSSKEKNYLKIDIHNHILPSHIPDFKKKFGYGGFIQLEHHKPNCAKMVKDDVFFREIESNCWNPETRVKECNTSGIDIQVLSTVPVMFSYWAKPKDALEVARFLNDDIAKSVKFNPKRFVGLGTLPMQDPDLAIEELKRCIQELHFPGVEIGTHINDWNLNDENLFPIFKEAEKLGACIFVHPWDMMGMDRMKKYWLPWLVSMPAETSLAICSMIFGGVFQKLPKLRVAFAHGGGSFPGTIGRIEHGFKVRPDLVAVDNKVNPREYIGKFWVDSLAHDPKQLQYIIDLFGIDKIALGTDYPFPLGELEPGKLIESMNFPLEINKKLFESNALQWLGLQRNKFI